MHFHTLRFATSRLLTLRFASLVLAGWTTSVVFATEAHAASPEPPADRVERGRYLTTIAFCNDCHTPFHMTENGPEPDMSRMLSGHPATMSIEEGAPAVGPWIGSFAATNTAWAGPWGVSFTANLTPDPATGIGDWSKEEFIGAIRSGRHRGRGRAILPPMPWPFLSQATDEDLASIFAFLRTIPPIENKVPDPIPPAP